LPPVAGFLSLKSFFRVPRQPPFLSFNPPNSCCPSGPFFRDEACCPFFFLSRFLFFACPPTLICSPPPTLSCKLFSFEDAPADFVEGPHFSHVHFAPTLFSSLFPSPPHSPDQAIFHFPPTRRCPRFRVLRCLPLALPPPCFQLPAVSFFSDTSLFRSLYSFLVKSRRA